MDIFFLLFQNLLPLYILITLGWIAGRFLGVEIKSLGSLGIYIFMPIVAFGFITKVDLQPIFITVPLIVAAMFSILTLIFYGISKHIYPDKRANLAAMCAGAGNTGYLGFPLALLLFPPEWVAIYILAVVGNSIYEATIMYYIANRGQFSVKQSLYKLLKFPTLYAITAGLCVNYWTIPLPEQFDTYWTYMKGAYVVVGMMIVGASLARSSRLVIAPRFLTFVFAGKFIIWPAVTLALITLDQQAFNIFPKEIHQIFFIISIVPPAANIAAFAAQLDIHPEKAATTILISTVIALFTIPFMLALSGLF